MALGVGRALRCYLPKTVRPQPQIVAFQSRWQVESSRLCRYFGRNSQESPHMGATDDVKAHFDQNWREYQQYFDFPPQTLNPDDFKEGAEVTIRGWLGRSRNMSAKLAFTPLIVDNGPYINLVSNWEVEGSDHHIAHQQLKAVPNFSSVTVRGNISQLILGSPNSFARDKRFPANVSRLELEVKSIQLLNPLAKDIIVSKGVRFPPKARHLQLRFDPDLRQRLYFRDYLVRRSRGILAGLGLCEVETPVLFKSTPEGAREFLVPTRRRGFAYALPQSPQQYKQVLMASGIPRYFQFARCFRDEDLRADRQPEFTQLDVEMAFATGEDVIQEIETFVKQLYSKISSDFVLRKMEEGGVIPAHRTDELKSGTTLEYADIGKGPFKKLSYEKAMALYGVDKPDLRVPNQICRIESIVPDTFVSMITDLKVPIVEACKFRLGSNMAVVRKFVTSFMDSLPTDLRKSPDGAPTLLMYDSTKPLQGLSSLGHECANAITGSDPQWSQLSHLEDGDVLLIQARPNEPFMGGSTSLGTTRNLLYRAAVSANLIPYDYSFRFLWVTDFPLFTPNNDIDPGQGGESGFSSTHHPFTAPKTAEDFELLITDPLRAKADHYDLVVNGVELGGGSRRIHIAKVQEFVMRDILRMSDDRVKDFSHLLEALRAGCPPHAGLALGWDRLVAILSGTDSIRDVIAFPKSMKGEDLFAKSPARMTRDQLETYHLALRKGEV